MSNQYRVVCRNSAPICTSGRALCPGAPSYARRLRTGWGNDPCTADKIQAMKAHVYVTLKKTVLDAQGQTIQNALRKLRFSGVEDVRQGKYFQLTLAEGAKESDARAEVERIASEVLTNPVIEEFTYKLEQ